jgi:hypothetical protein
VNGPELPRRLEEPNCAITIIIQRVREFSDLFFSFFLATKVSMLALTADGGGWYFEMGRWAGMMANSKRRQPQPSCNASACLHAANSQLVMCNRSAIHLSRLDQEYPSARNASGVESGFHWSVSGHVMFLGENPL